MDSNGWPLLFDDVQHGLVVKFDQSALSNYKIGLDRMIAYMMYVVNLFNYSIMQLQLQHALPCLALPTVGGSPCAERVNRGAATRFKR